MKDIVIMLMSGFDEDILSYFDYECTQTDNYYTHRKGSFVDLLSLPMGIPEDLIDLHMDTVSKEWELPELNTEPSETSHLELNLDQLFEKESKANTKETIIKIIIQQNPERRNNELIGTLTPDQRRLKISKYLEKRKKRTWQKRIYYDCRKRVADNRLRIKGRFVTKDQAIDILGPDHEIVKNL